MAEMKTGLTTSVLMHAAVLGFGLVTLSAPRAYEVADVEALPVEIIPVESITQIQKGDREAPKAEKSAPVPTTRPDIVEDAREIGNNKTDTEAPPTPEPAPRPVETAALSQSAPEPAPEMLAKPEPEPKPQPAPEPEPVPATELTPEPQPRQEVKLDPVAEAIAAEPVPDEGEKLPERAPVPQARPEPPQAQTAKAPERKDAERPAAKEAAKPKSEEKEYDFEDIAALLNKQQPSGGGAARSTEQVSLGGRTQTPGATELTQSEIDALRAQIQQCWNVPAGAEGASGLRASVQFSVDSSGRLSGPPQVVQSSGDRWFDESTVRAVQKCNERGFALPAGKHEVWANILLNFDPSQMF